MAMLGVSQLIVMFLLGGGIGIPVGIPPGPDDPVLAQVAPEECLYYTSWAGFATPDPKSTNHTEQLLAEPDVQHFIKEVQVRLREGLSRLAARESDERAIFLVDVVPELVKTLITRPAAIFVSNINLERGRLGVEGAMIVNVGNSAAETKSLLAELQGEVLPQAPNSVEILGNSFRRLQLAPNVPMLTWGFKNDYFLIGVGERAIEGVLDRWETDAPQWLNDLKTQFPLERRSTLTYANLKQIVEMVTAAASDPTARAVMDAIGIGNLTSYKATSGLGADGIVKTSVVEFDGAPRGLFSIADATPLSPQDLKNLPPDSIVVVAVRLDATHVLDHFLQMLGEIHPLGAGQIHDGLKIIGQSLGFDLRDDLLMPLGDMWSVYTAPGNGGLALGWTAAVHVRDRERLNGTLQQLMEFVRRMAGQQPRGPQIKELQFAGHDIYFLSIPDSDFLIAPAWCISKDQLLISLFPQGIKSHLRRGANGPSLADRPEVARLFESDNGPLLMTYYRHAGDF